MLQRLRGTLWRARRAFPRLNNVHEWVRGTKHPVFLHYPVHVKSRWGFAEPEHGLISDYLGQYSDRFLNVVSEMTIHSDEFAKIPRSHAMDSKTPIWLNDMFPALDAMALYNFLVKLNPKQYVEIGSGNSTKFARLAIDNHKLRTRIVSIDPCPRAEVNALCDQSIRAKLQDQDLSVFSGLEPGDILFLDGSHYSYTNSDTVVFFLSILPQLRSGVWVQIHDIHLPMDYAPVSAECYWTEQYMLATYILGGAARMDMQLANAYVSKKLDIAPILAPVFSAPNLHGIAETGMSFWFSIY